MKYSRYRSQLAEEFSTFDVQKAAMWIFSIFYRHVHVCLPDAQLMLLDAAPNLEHESTFTGHWDLDAKESEILAISQKSPAADFVFANALSIAFDVYRALNGASVASASSAADLSLHTIELKLAERGVEIEGGGPDMNLSDHPMIYREVEDQFDHARRAREIRSVRDRAEFLQFVRSNSNRFLDW